MEVNISSAVLSAIFPGLGQLKNLDLGKGFFLILFFTLLLIMGFHPESPAVIQLIGFILLPMAWVWGVVDASQAFLYRPGIAVGPSEITRALLIVLIGWLVIEAITVPILVWQFWHRETESTSASQEEFYPFPQTTEAGGSAGLQPTQASQLASPSPSPAEPAASQQGTSAETKLPETAALSPGIQPQVSSSPPSPAPSRSESPESQGDFAISLGIFAGPVQAGKQRDAAVEAGFPAEVHRVRVRGQIRYIVLVPGFQTNADARGTLSRLRRHSRFRDSIVVRLAKLQFVE